MEYVRRRDRIIIKLPKVTDFYLATLIREEEGIFYVKLDRGDYFSFKNKDLIVERGIDRICPELITVDRIYDYVRGIGDVVTHVNKPETQALIPVVEEVITPEAEIREEALVDKKEEIEEDKSEDADSLEEDVPEDLEAYDEASEESDETPTEGKEPNSDDMFDVPVEKLDESVTIDEKKPEETEEPTEETEEVDDSVEVEESEEPTEDNEESPEESEEEIEKSIDETEESSEDNEETEEPSDEVVDDSEEVEEPEEVDDSVEIEDNDESPEEELSEEVDDSVEDPEEDEEEEEEESDEEVAVESNIEESDIMVEDSSNEDEGDMHEALFSNMPYYMRSLLLLEAARSFSKNDRLVIRVRAENKYYLATVTMNRKGMLHVLFDHGEKHSLKPSSSLIMGIGQQKKYPYAITLNQLHRFLLVPYNTKIVKDKVTRKVLSPLELHEKAKQYIPEEPKIVKDRVKKDNTGPYPVKTPIVKPFKTSYKKKLVKLPKQDKHETGYLSKMSSKEIDDMLS